MNRIEPTEKWRLPLTDNRSVRAEFLRQKSQPGTLQDYALAGTKLANGQTHRSLGHRPRLRIGFNHWLKAIFTQ